MLLTDIFSSGLPFGGGPLERFGVWQCIFSTVCPCGELIDEVGELFAEHAQRKGLELTCAVAPDVYSSLRGDAGRLRQILTNLLGNACKFTQAGEVALRVTVLAEQEEEALLRFEVRDTGMGIPPEARPRLFASFSQADSSTTRKLVARILKETDLDADALELEITESLLMKDPDGATGILQDLKALGVQLAIDDFGTGYSSLSRLKQLPLDRLKIDKAFVREVNTRPDDAAITTAVIAMAESMGLRVIAEGVENEAQLGFLRSRRCDEIQGYYLSRPLPVDQITALLQHHQQTYVVTSVSVARGQADQSKFFG